VKPIPKFVLLASMVFLSLAGCDRGGGTVGYGNLTYNATEVFGKSTPALELAKAAGRGDGKEINRLIASGTNVNTVGQHNITPLWWALWTKNYEGFVTLLAKGANPNAQRTEGYPIMYLAADMSDSRFLEAALKHGGDANLPDKRSGWPPLVMAVQNGYKQNVDLLLAAKGDANWQDSISGETLPMVALGARVDYEMAYELLQHGADPTLTAFHGKTLADTIELVSKNASNNNDPWRAKVLEFLKSKGVMASKPANK
jgi:ankyrin repeat protein